MGRTNENGLEPNKIARNLYVQIANLIVIMIHKAT